MKGALGVENEIHVKEKNNSAQASKFLDRGTVLNMGGFNSRMLLLLTVAYILSWS